MNNIIVIANNINVGVNNIIVIVNNINVGVNNIIVIVNNINVGVNNIIVIANNIIVIVNFRKNNKGTFSEFRKCFLGLFLSLFIKGRRMNNRL